MPAAPIAVQLYSLREAAARDFAAVIERLGRIGYAGVELAGLHGMPPAELRRRLADAGLEIAAAHVQAPIGDARERVLDEQEALGTKTLVVPFVPPDRFKTLDSIRAVAAELDEACRNARARGMALGYHNHWWEFEIEHGGKQRARPADGARRSGDLRRARHVLGDASAVGIPRGSRPSSASRVRLLHLKDGPADGFKSPMTAVGDGVLDFPAITASGASAALARRRARRLRDGHVRGDREEPPVPGRPRPLAGARLTAPARRARTGIGIIGCGVISHAYAAKLAAIPDVELVACADLDAERTRELADKHAIPQALEPERLLRSPDVEVVLNLTIPAAHAQVSADALAAGKSVYGEKPLALDLEGGRRLLAQAERGRAADRLRARHVPRRGHPDLPQADRRRRDRRAARRQRVHPLARTGELAPAPADLLPARRGSALRHGPVLPDRAGRAARTRAQGHGLRAHLPRAPRDHEPAARGHDDGRRGAHARRERDRLPLGSGRHARDELRRAGVAPTQHRDLRQRGRRSPCPIRTRSAARCRSGGAATRSGATSRSRTRTRRRAAASGWSRWCARCAAARPHRASGELACHVLELMEKSVLASETGGTVTLETRCERPAPLAPRVFPTTCSSATEGLREPALRHRRRRIPARLHAARAHAGARRRGRGTGLAQAARSARRVSRASTVSVRRASSARSQRWFRTSTSSPSSVRTSPASRRSSRSPAAVRAGARLSGLICEKPLARNLARGAARARARARDRRADRVLREPDPHEERGRRAARSCRA